MRRPFSNGTSFRATIASKAVPAPISAFATRAAYANGWATNALFGQSYQLAGENSFASPDLVNAGAFSGLETDTSDFVGLAGFASPRGLSASASARLDEQTLELRRAELKAGYVTAPLTLTAKYAFIQNAAALRFSRGPARTHIAASSQLRESWRVFGSATYDFETNVLVRDAAGFAYDDECFSYSMTLSETRDRITEDSSQSVGFNVSFRTIGDFGTNTSMFNTQ